MFHVLTLCTLACFSIQSPEEEQPSAREKASVLLWLGDRIPTSKTGGEKTHPAVLQQLLDERDASWRVVTVSNPAFGSKAGLLELEQAVTEHAPAIVCLQVGAVAMTATETDDTGGESAVLAKQIERAIAACEAEQAIPVLVGYPSKSTSNLALRAIAAKQKVRFVDLQKCFTQKLSDAPDTELLTPDGASTDAGHELIAKVVLDELNRSEGAPLRLVERVRMYCRLREQNDWTAVYAMTDEEHREGMTLEAYLKIYGTGVLKAHSLEATGFRLDSTHRRAVVSLAGDFELVVANLPANVRASSPVPAPETKTRVSQQTSESWVWEEGSWWLHVPQVPENIKVQGR